MSAMPDRRGYARRTALARIQSGWSPGRSLGHPLQEAEVDVPTAVERQSVRPEPDAGERGPTNPALIHVAVGRVSEPVRVTSRSNGPKSAASAWM